VLLGVLDDEPHEACHNGEKEYPSKHHHTSVHDLSTTHDVVHTGDQVLRSRCSLRRNSIHENCSVFHFLKEGGRASQINFYITEDSR